MNGVLNVVSAARSRRTSTGRPTRSSALAPVAPASSRRSSASRAIRAASDCWSGVVAAAAESSVVSTLSCTSASTLTRSISVACCLRGDVVALERRLLRRVDLFGGLAEHDDDGEHDDAEHDGVERVEHREQRARHRRPTRVSRITP